MLKISLLLFLFLPIACSSDDKEQNGLPPEGYIFAEDGSLAPQTPGKCRIGLATLDCPPPFNACPNGVCQVLSTSPSDKYWFATDPIRPAVTSDCNASSGCTNPTGYIYNIMAKGYDSLDDWCASQAHLSNDKNVHNKSKWRALIVANGDGNNGRPNTINPGTVCSFNDNSWTECSGFDLYNQLGIRLSEVFPNGAIVNDGMGGVIPFQSSINGYRIPKKPKGAECVNGLCDKFGEDIISSSFGFSYATAWLGFDVGCTNVQIGGGCHTTSQCLTTGSNNYEWNAASLSSRPTAYWSDTSGDSSGSIYISSGKYSSAGCGFKGFNAGGRISGDVFTTADNYQQRVICLSD